MGTVSTSMPQPEDLVSRLSELLANRQIPEGIEILKDQQTLLETLSPNTPGDAIGCFWQLGLWTDAGFDSRRLFQDAMKRFQGVLPNGLVDQLHLQMAHATDALFRGDEPEVIKLCTALVDAVSIDGRRDSVEFRDLAIIATFFRGRALRNLGEYKEATRDALAASDAAQFSGRFNTKAVIEIMHAWLLFQQGEP